MALTADKVRAWADVAMLVLTHGLAGWGAIGSIIKAAKPDVTDAELNEIIRAVQADAKRRKAISEQIANAPDPGA